MQNNPFGAIIDEAIIKHWAHGVRVQYLALVDEGFTRNQAMSILIAMIEKSVETYIQMGLDDDIGEQETDGS